MEDATVYSRKGVLSHLENLEARAHKAGLKQGEVREQQENAVRLEMRIQELKCQRDELRAKLSVCRSQLARSNDTIKSGRQASQATETSKQALLEWKMANVKGLLQVFHLAGLSGKLTKQGVCLCINTAFEGTYLDSYYLDLLLQQPVRILRHSVPAFIPLEQIAQKYLQADIKSFSTVLSDHLNAFAGRKYQADQLQEGFAAFLEGPLQGNSLYNLLEFKYHLAGEAGTFLFTAKLAYGDPVHILPTEATVTCEETDTDPDAGSEMVAAHLPLFRQKPLHEAFRSITDSAANLGRQSHLSLHSSRTASQPPSPL